jgi:DNA invertase Pin-like site-specific DNA recombinase
VGYEVMGIWKETASGMQDDRSERNKVMALAQARRIDAILVPELTRWGRSRLDLVHMLHELQARGVSRITQTSRQFDLSTPHGKLIASLMSVLAEFERDLLRERIRSGLAAAKARGTLLGRRPGQRIKADRLTPKVLEYVKTGWSYREIEKAFQISKNTVTEIVKRHRHPRDA